VPERPEDVDEAFARLVADFDAPHRGDGEDTPWPASEDVDDEPTQPVEDEEPAQPEDLLVGPGYATSGPDPLDTEATWEDEGHFVPPEPPPIPRPTPLRLAAWLGVLVGPVVLTVVAALGWWIPDLVMALLVVGFVGGVVYLIATMGDEPRDPYGPDNGAVV
jgi:hypothetical protein